MATDRGWLGFSQRWFRRQIPVDPVEIVNVGNDRADGERLEACSLNPISLGATTFHAYGIEVQPGAPIYLEALWYRTATLAYPGHSLIVGPRLPGAVSMVGDPRCTWLRQAPGGVGPVDPWVVGALVAWPAGAIFSQDVQAQQWSDWPLPGLLVEPGESVYVATGQANDTPTVTFWFRRT